MVKHKQRWALVGVMVVAIALRFYQLSQVPDSLYWDEVAILADAKTVAATGHDIHNQTWWQAIFPSYGDYKLPIYIWLTTLVVKLFGVSQWAVRLPSALAGVGTVWLAGLLAHELFTKFNQDKKQKDKKQKDKKHRWQLLTMLVVAISPWSILFSRTGFEGHLAQLFLGGSVYLVVRAARAKTKSSWWWLIGASLLGALATYTYFSVRFVWPLVYLATLICLQFKQKIIKFVLPLAVFLLALLPLWRSPHYAASEQFRYSTDSVLRNEARVLKQNQYRAMAGNTWLDRLSFHRHLLFIKDLATNYADNLSLNFLFLEGDPNLRHGTGEHGLFLLCFLPFFLVGFYQLFTDKKRILVLLVTWWLVALAPASVPNQTPHALRSLNALLPLSLIIGYGLQTTVSHLAEKLNKKYAVILLVLILGLSLSFSYHYFTQYKIDSSSAFQGGYRQLAELIEEKGNQASQIKILTFDDRFYLWLLAFTNLTPQEIQAIPRQSRQSFKLEEKQVVAQFENQNQAVEQTLWVGSKNQVEAKFSQTEADWWQEVASLDQKKAYILALKKEQENHD